MQDTALTLWRVYCLMTIVLTVLLYIAGMDWFDALNHSFSTVATGGFSTKNNSIAAYPQASIQWILIFFMFIAGINFSLHAQALRGVVKVYLRDRECRFYTVLLILGSAVIVAGLVEHGLFGMRSFPEFEAVTRAAVFQLVSVCTTTGFVSENFNLWPSITLVIILMFMLMGGCAGSTGGGVKTSTMAVLCLNVRMVARGRSEIAAYHRTINRDTMQRALAIVMIGLAVLLIDIMALTLLEPQAQFLDLAFECASALGTVGVSSVGTPTLGGVSRFLLILAMYIGRVGPLTLNLALGHKQAQTKDAFRYPEERVLVG